MAASNVCRLHDGRAVVLRLAGARDVPAITRLYLELSPESRYRRFNAAGPVHALATAFARIDGETVCLVAASPADQDRPIGEARYVPVGPGTAELAMTVLDSYQGAGLGHLLLAALVSCAREDGFERLRAIVMLDNGPMLRLLQHYGWALAGPTEDYVVACLEISTIGGMPGWPADSTRRRVLLERRGWSDDPQVAALRAAGNDIRQCTGPRQRTGRSCPLVTSGQCRLAEEADLIVNLLPEDDGDCAAVLAAHRRHWPHLLARPRMDSATHHLSSGL
jgi:GNAT superfamily N-acetyltransferase